MTKISMTKTEAVLEKARSARRAGQQDVTLSTESLIKMLEYIQSLHSVVRDVQLDLVPASMTSNPAEIHHAILSSLSRIEDTLGPMRTLFDEISEIESQ